MIFWRPSRKRYWNRRSPMKSLNVGLLIPSWQIALKNKNRRGNLPLSDNFSPVHSRSWFCNMASMKMGLMRWMPRLTIPYEQLQSVLKKEYLPPGLKSKMMLHRQVAACSEIKPDLNVLFTVFDTHTHFDVPDFDADREQLAHAAKAVGVERLILIGFVQSRFAGSALHAAFSQSIKGCSSKLFSTGFASCLYWAGITPLHIWPI